MADDPLVTAPPVPIVRLAERVRDACFARSTTLVTAESCTGGLLASVITDVPGSSAYFLGSVVSYADAVKREVLGVPGDVLAAHGAVSAQVAKAMAEGARTLLRADVAVAVTGIAGPDGGSEEKPVGLTYVAVADAAGADVRRFLWPGDRAANKEASAKAALELVLERVEAQVPPRSAG